MTQPNDNELYEGVSINVMFPSPGPTFGDLYLLCGQEHPNFPSSGNFEFQRLAHLQFSQIDDYFGVRTLSGIGDDVAVWLYPIVDDHPVDHDPGPFDALRLDYNVLRNPADRSNHFLRCVADIAALSSSSSVYLEQLRDRIDAIIRHWRDQGIEVGSEEALAIDF